MNILYVNKLLSEVQTKLIALDPELSEADLEMQQSDPSDSENDSARLGAAKMRLSHLLAKLGANRDDSNRVKAYGTGGK